VTQTLVIDRVRLESRVGSLGVAMMHAVTEGLRLLLEM
jgi:hypothetical protein